MTRRLRAQAPSHGRSATIRRPGLSGIDAAVAVLWSADLDNEEALDRIIDLTGRSAGSVNDRVVVRPRRAPNPDIIEPTSGHVPARSGHLRLVVDNAVR